MSFLTDTFGRRIKVPEIPQINVNAVQQQAIAGNQAALPGAERLASSVNTFNQEQLNKLLEAAIPDYQAIKGNASKNIEAWTRGEIPSDVQSAIERSAAAKALSGGFAGSQAHGGLVARDLGMTSLNLMDQGMNAAEKWIANARNYQMPQLFDVTSMFFSPQQRLAFETEERNLRWQRDYLQEQINAMPDPLIRGIQDSIAEVGMAFLGGSHTPYYQQASQAQRTTGMDWGKSTYMEPAQGSGWSTPPEGTGYNWMTDQSTAPGAGFDFGGMGGGGGAEGAGMAVGMAGGFI